jgi:antibiotic biosynthesis monooxygenase (ABM) superfamily enzyme
METTKRPRPWKLALLSWLCIYPLINLLFATLMPLIAPCPVLLRTLLMSLMLVPLMGLLMGFLQTRFKDWLHRQSWSNSQWNRY